jgi:hypothetical protein
VASVRSAASSCGAGGGSDIKGASNGRGGGTCRWISEYSWPRHPGRKETYCQRQQVHPFTYTIFRELPVQIWSDVDITLSQEPEFIQPINSKNTNQTVLHYAKKAHYEEQNNKQLFWKEIIMVNNLQMSWYLNISIWKILYHQVAAVISLYEKSLRPRACITNIKYSQKKCDKHEYCPNIPLLTPSPHQPHDLLFRCSHIILILPNSPNAWNVMKCWYDSNAQRNVMQNSMLTASEKEEDGFSITFKCYQNCD